MNIDFLFNFKKIKYEIMTELFENIKLSKTVNIIIDFDTLFETFKLEYYKNMVEKLATAENKFHFISAVFNFIGHYRNFFATRLDTHTRFFVLYNSKNDSIRDAIKPDFTLQYDRNMQNKKFALFILNKCKLLNNYFPDISFIDSEDIHHTLVPNILINNLSYFKTEKTIFLNDNPLYFQYLELFNGCMLNPSNNSSNIMSVKNEYFKRFLKRSKYKYTSEEEKLTDYLIPFHLALLADFGFDLLDSSRRNSVKTCLKIDKEGNYVNILTENILFEFEKRVELFSSIQLGSMIPASSEAIVLSQINNNSLVSFNKIHSLNNMHLNNEINLNWLM